MKGERDVSRETVTGLLAQLRISAQSTPAMCLEKVNSTPEGSMLTDWSVTKPLKNIGMCVKLFLATKQ
jgi:hypothetical protein